MIIPTGTISKVSYVFEDKEGRHFIFSSIIWYNESSVGRLVKSMKRLPPPAIPDGWYVCDGSEKSRVDDASLFSLIGTKYGEGDGVTTFNIPEMTVEIEFFVIKR